jgi:hypothetical protein
MIVSVMCFRTFSWSYSRGAEISETNWLVHSDLPPQDIAEQRLVALLLDLNYKCNGCAQCNGTFKCRSFKHPQTGRSIPIKGVITWSTKIVIYLITCPCGKNYVGKTKRKLKVRISEHRSTIRCKSLLTQLRPTSWKQATRFRLCVINWHRTCHPP